MKHTVSFIFAVACFFVSHVHASEGIMVWRLEKGSGVDAETITTVSGFVTGQVERYSDREIISEGEIKTLLKGEETRQKCGGEDMSCMAEIGNALGVPKAVSGDLGRMGDYWILNLRLIDIRRARVLSRVSRDIKGDTNALIQELPYLVEELFEEAPPPQAKPRVRKRRARRKSSSSLSTAGWATLGTGIALVALGGTMHYLAVDEADTNSKSGNGDKSAFEAYKGTAITGYVVGGALLTAGIVLLSLDGKKKERVSALPSVGSDGKSVTVFWGARW